MDLTWKTVFKVFRQCLGERTFSPVAGHCFYTELFRLDIGPEFWTRLLYYLDINAVPVASGVEFIVVSVKDYRVLTGLTKDSGCCGVPE